jgi:predicted Zn-dependent peptidase
MKPIVKTLKNGMTAIVVPQKGATSMTFMAFCRVGSRYETKDINGASHFIEHLMFKGTKRRPDTLTISKELDRYGAEYNAFTSKDLTAYYVKMDAAKTALAADILNDMLFHSKYDPKELERERGVIVEEINMYEDNPRMHIDDLLEEVLFPNSTLGWNIAGPREVIRTVPREKLIKYRDAYYIPERMAVCVAGKIVPDIWKILEKTFGSVKSPKARQDHEFEKFHAPVSLKEPVALQQKTTEQVQLAMAFHALSLDHKDLPAASLLATILGGTMSSRLFIQVRERRGLCYSVSASHQALEDIGIFGVMSGLDKTRVDEAVKVIWSELKKTTKELVKPEELKRAKDHIRGKLMLAFEDSSTQADWYGKQWIFQNKAETPEERLRKIDKVTAADIRRVAKMIFNPEKMASAVIGPFDSKEHVKKLFKLS